MLQKKVQIHSLYLSISLQTVLLNIICGDNSNFIICGRISSIQVIYVHFSKQTYQMCCLYFPDIIHLDWYTQHLNTSIAAGQGTTQVNQYCQIQAVDPAVCVAMTTSDDGCQKGSTLRLLNNCFLVNYIQLIYTLAIHFNIIQQIL